MDSLRSTEVVPTSTGRPFLCMRAISRRTGSNALNLGTGTVALGAATRQVTVNASTLTVGGVISGTNSAAGLTKAGTGTLSLDAANTYTGVTTVSGGVLLLNNANALPGGIGATGRCPSTGISDRP